MGKKSERGVAVEAAFVSEGDAFKCLVDNCGALVKCQVKNGYPGRISHLQRVHHEAFNKLPSGRPFLKKVVPTVVVDGCAFAPATQPSDGMVTTKRGRDKYDDDVCDVFARQLFPFSVADDPFFRQFATS